MKNKLLVAIALAALGYGCKKGSDQTLFEPPLTMMAKTVTKSRNPYALNNMRQAMASLLMKDLQLLANNKQAYAHGKVSFSTGAGELGISKTLTAKESITLVNKEMVATHYYLKFIPRNDADYAKLKLDSNLVVYPFPLDAETSPYSGSYRDPSVPAGVPTYQYAAVPVGYALPDVPYVKLEDLYLPDERQAKNKVVLRGEGQSAYAVSTRMLVDESICGNGAGPKPVDYTRKEEQNEDCEAGIGSGGGGGGNDPFRAGENWKPHGRLTMYDESLKKTIGVEGVKVRARRWFTTYTGISDHDGYYAVDGWYTRPANYWLDFERYDFSVNNPAGQPHEVNGPKIEAAWNVDFDGYSKYVSTIFRAAFHYYHKDIQGLRRPPQNSFWKTQLKIRAVPESNATVGGFHLPQLRILNMAESIWIYNPTFLPEDIYATTIHELAHAVHWDMAASDYRNCNDNVSESWSVGVQWTLTKMEYPGYYGRPNGTLNYTNWVMDLIDLPGQEYTKKAPNEGYWFYGMGAPEDRVEGYNIVQIQNALIGVRNLEAWRNNLFYQYENNTENNLDALLAYWVVR